jgi:uncharacterized membrane protein
MEPSSNHFLPLAPLFFLALVVLLIAAVTLIEVGVVSYASEKMGISRRLAFLLLFLSLIGSYVNIPVAEIPGERVLSGVEVQSFGIRYFVPLVRQGQGTIVALNLGGAIIPTMLSLYLLIKNQLYLPSLAGVAIVSAVLFWMAKPTEGVGITVPVLLPPLITALVALLLSRESAAPLAYISGTLGTLIGADLLHLDALQGMHAPVASIGGAGTFDGIFMIGLTAMLLA